MTIREAIKKFVNDGDTVSIACDPEGAAESACHEIIRQRKRGLIFVGSGGFPLDMMVGAGCIKRLISSYIGGEIFGRNYCIERALAKGIPHKLEVEDYSHFLLALRRAAGSMGMPFLPTKTALGTDIIKYLGDKVRVIEDPFSGEKVVVVPPLNPDVGIFHAQRADKEGNVQAWGLGRGSVGCKKIIVSVEEIVDTEVIRRNPYLTVIPGFAVDAIVLEPWGAHPDALQGFYDIDIPMKILYSHLSRTIEGFEKFMDEWVYGVEDRTAYVNHYIKKYGYERLRRLIPKAAFTDPINMGLYVASS
jgi:glutaconate CoA-transferase subunit A